MSPSNATAKLMKSAFDILASPKLKCFDKALSKVITLFKELLKYVQNTSPNFIYDLSSQAIT